MTVTVAGQPLLAFVLAAVRIVAWLVVVPPFSTRSFPTSAKIVLSLGLAFAVAPAMAQSRIPVDTGGLAITVVTQAAIGLSMGFLTSLLFAAVSAAGSLIDVFGGFALAAAFDPLGMNMNTVFGKFHQMLATVLLFVSGGHLLVIGGLLRTFEMLPIGESPHTDTGTDLLMRAFHVFFVTSVQIALPMVAVLFVADLGLALMTKVAPQLNAINVLFPAKIGLTLMLLGLTFPVLPGVIRRLVELSMELTAAFAGGAEMAESGGEKTEKPTDKKRKESRKQGQVARTQELGAWSAMLLAAMAMPLLLSRELHSLQGLLSACLRATAQPSVDQAWSLLDQGMTHAFVALVLLGSMVLLVSVAATVAQGGFYLATKAVKPSASKLNLLKGAKRIFGPHALWEGVKMLVKCSLVAVLVWSSVQELMPMLGGMVPIGVLLDITGGHALSLLRNVAVAGLVMAAVDYGMQRRRIGKQTRMSKEDVKQEHKATEGDPQVKSAIRQRQLAGARNRMMSDVAQADVVLVNPTHVAVALRYDPAKGAPMVVARGAGAIAAKIREIATEADVPLVRDVPLARALYASSDVGHEIPAELFGAVAHVLAFVISRRNQGRRGGNHAGPRRATPLPAVPGVPERRRQARAARVAARPAEIPSGPLAASR